MIDKNPSGSDYVVVIIFFLLICFSVHFFVKTDWNKDNTEHLEELNYQCDLVQISNTKDINGRTSTGIFCGQGYINEIPYYYTYVKKNDKIQLLKIRAENNDLYTVTIYQDNNNPYIKSKGTIIYNDKFLEAPSYLRQDIEIHIPPGSMVQNIDINSENFK